MRVGLLGLGRIGAFHAATLSALADELVVSDADQSRAEEVAGRLKARVGDPFDADAVVIATPTATHAELLVRACDLRVPAFCEKPAAPGVAETIRVADAAERSGTVVHIGFQRRFDAGYTAAREALRSGELGTLHRVHMITADPAPPAPGYVPMSGGIFRDCHIHDFDILRWVTGREVESVYATGANRGAAFFAEAGDVDNSAALLTLDDGTLVTLQGSRYNGAGYDVRMELAGTLRTRAVGLDPRTPLTSAEGLQPPGEPWPDFVTRFDAAYVAEMSAFLAAARGERESPCTAQDALAALYIAEAADLSRRDDRPVRLLEVAK
ncbi:myo-inositol 2-dehydrogenase / D-chiro-inositol 1-dehydrogenase [Streptosporangium canum]|uniref:Myo-inositol 2-dehydrogenase / D-chiro-inositol 1-dehydrogenase n=1 Tax=Streptosporangium canum TaxID=324952 RepID=A0A1I4D0P0_9ACTN|nr:Gfo/Idh/MocA family oxidoreductase [Streptosporangium canum]SFK87118.1 myo-inositol 2-dehydrogenase / D-chiro-inositol 1-dehydrogenase [Streptosporangium canum]